MRCAAEILRRNAGCGRAVGREANRKDARQFRVILRMRMFVLLSFPLMRRSRSATFYNFCRIHKSLRVTPAMAAGIADRVWDISELLMA